MIHKEHKQVVHEEVRGPIIHEKVEKPVVEKQFMNPIVKDEGMAAPLIKEEKFLASEATGTLPGGQVFPAKEESLGDKVKGVFSDIKHAIVGDSDKDVIKREEKRL